MNHRLRHRHRYLVALVAAGVFLAALIVASRPLPDPRIPSQPAAQPGAQPAAQRGARP